MTTAVVGVISSALIENYFNRLVNGLYKILPMFEEGNKTLSKYMRSLQLELVGLGELVPSIGLDADYLSLLAILQHLTKIDKCEQRVVRSEVFHAIDICNKIGHRARMEASNE